MKIRLLSILGLVLMINVVGVRHYVVYAPELFGRQSMTYLDLPFGFIAGIVYGPDVIFVLAGRHNDHVYANLSQVGGDRIDNYGIRGPIQARMKFSDDDRRFKGWIFFRGHERKFCGGYDNIPANCMLKQ